MRVGNTTFDACEAGFAWRAGTGCDAICIWFVSLVLRRSAAHVFFSLSSLSRMRVLASARIFCTISLASAAAADPLEEEVPLVVDMTFRWVNMTLREEILESQN